MSNKHLTQFDKQTIQQMADALGDFRNAMLRGGVQPFHLIPAYFIIMCSMMEGLVSTIETMQTKAREAPSPVEAAEWMGHISFHSDKLDVIGPWMHEFVTQQMMQSFGHNPGYFFGRGVYDAKVVIHTSGGEYGYVEHPEWVQVVVVDDEQVPDKEPEPQEPEGSEG